VYTSRDTRVHIISFLDVEELYPITYKLFRGFTVHLPNREILFEKRGKLHIVDFAGTAETNIVATEVHTKVEIEWAMKVQELIRMSGNHSYQELAYMVQDGNLTNLPTLTAMDIQRAQNLYGKVPEFVRGRMTSKKTRKAIIDNGLVLEEKRLTLHTDEMHIDSQCI
jgi:hypothetical protein